MANRIYTRNGDNGTTTIGGNLRLPKYDERIEAIGTLEELTSYLGILRDLTSWPNISEKLALIQNKLISCAAIISNTNIKTSIDRNDIELIETEIDKIDSILNGYNGVFLPGGHPLISYCDIARSICRRAERKVSLVSDKYNTDKSIVAYLNRLSDYLYMLSLFFVKALNVKPIEWKP
ncbi:MAG: cob(I)yrinic acid a,c-diamide adenosyltransferase [Bacteroidales bacterium]|nr:cob(I)yrinic acid a,c-diamide adenosyltransferase [Bacteroidales bacterium]